MKYSFKISENKIKDVLSDYIYEEVKIGRSGAKVYKLIKNNQIVMFLKINFNNKKLVLKQEADKIEWLKDIAMVPKLLHYEKNENCEILVTSAIKGENASIIEDEKNIHLYIKKIAHALRNLHDIKISECPFISTNEYVLKEIKHNIENELIDKNEIIKEFGFKDIWEGYETLKSMSQHIDEELVFTHGDFSLTNIIINEKEVNGIIDLGKAGISDKYADLAIIGKSISMNYGNNWIPIFYKEYGLESINKMKAEFYLLLEWFY